MPEVDGRLPFWLKAPGTPPAFLLRCSPTADCSHGGVYGAKQLVCSHPPDGHSRNSTICACEPEAYSSWHWTFWPSWPRPSAAVCAFEPDGLRQPALNPLAEMAEDTVHQNTILATLRPALRAGWLAAGGTGPAGRDGRAHWAAGAVPAGDSAGDSACRKYADCQPALGLLSD